MNKRENPRLYFLKLQDDFFKSADMKRLRKVAGGATYTVIYLKMLVESLPYDGKLYFEGFDSTFEEQIALMIDENVDDIKMTLAYLERIGAIQYGNSNTVLNFVSIPEMTYQISESTIRSRKSRAKKRAEALEASKKGTLEEKCTNEVCCNATQVQHEGSEMCCDATQMQQECSIDNRYIDNRYLDNKDIKSDEPTLSLQETESEDPEEPKKKQRAPFQKPTVEEIDSYIRDKGYPVDAQEFFNYYEDNEWHCGKIPMKNWKNAVYAWNKNQKRWSDEKAQKAAEAKTKNSFQQNTYDYEQLEKDLVKN